MNYTILKSGLCCVFRFRFSFELYVISHDDELDLSSTNVEIHVYSSKLSMTKCGGSGRDFTGT